MTGIIVGIDGSDNGTAALRWAIREGKLRDLDVTAVHVWGTYDPTPASGEIDVAPAYNANEAREALATAVEAAVGAEAARTLDQRVVVGQPARGLLDAAEKAELLVVGARGVGGLRGWVLGSVAQQCLHHTRVPLAIVPGGDHEDGDRGPERIVVGVDGSEASRHAFEWALDEARLRQATVDAVHAWHMPYSTAYPATFPVPDSGAVEEGARTVLDRIVDGGDARGLPHPVERIVAPGTAAQVVLDVAQGADLVVLGSRGLGGFQGLLLGSVTQHVANHLVCPLVVLPN